MNDKKITATPLYVCPQDQSKYIYEIYMDVASKNYWLP
jgi:hypothetical protein